MHAVLRAALNDAAIPANPAAAVKLGKVHRARPLLWTAARTQTMGHATAAFTADVYVTVLEEMAESAASAIAAFVPRKNKIDAGRAINVPSAGEDDH